MGLLLFKVLASVGALGAGLWALATAGKAGPEQRAVRELESEALDGIRSSAVDLERAGFRDEAEALRLQANRASARRVGGTVTPAPTWTGKERVSVSNAEWLARLLSLQGNPERLRAWARAYDKLSVFSAANELRAKADTAQAARTPIPPGFEGSGYQNLPAPGMPSPEELQRRVAEAVKTADSGIMRKVADELERLGATVAAAELRRLADEVDRGKAPVSPPTSSPPAEPPSPPPRAPPPTAPPASPPPFVPPALPFTPLPPPSHDPQKLARAQTLALHLGSVRKYKEDRSKVKAFQVQEGLKADGLYGANTALALAYYGIAPPTPFYWPQKGAQTAKDAYVAELAARATKAEQAGNSALAAELRDAAGKVV